MAKRKRKSAKVTDKVEPYNELSKFKFPHDKIYSHENRTILIHPGNYHLMDEIVNVEISSDTARKQGFIVLRLHDDLRNIISDESMYQFLVENGDHEKAKQKMKPDIITFGNVHSNQKQKKPIGIFCHNILLESIEKGESVKSLDEKQKSKLGVTTTTAETQEITSTCVLNMPSDIMIKEKIDANFTKGQFTHAEGIELSNICPCGKYCTEHLITNAELDNHTIEGRPLLHEAYVGQLRLKKYRSLVKDSVADPTRLNDEDLLDFEAILNRMLQKDLNFEYMLHRGTIKTEPTISDYMTTTHKYDMSKQKNEIDECIIGDAENGITFPWTYFGFAGSVFATHVEDIAYLNSINLMLYGCPKVWIFVSADQALDLQRAVAKYLQANAAKGKSEFLDCTLQHKMTFVHPGLLDLWGIRYTVVVQKPGDIIYTCAAAFHTGCNLGLNVNVAKNSIHYDFKIMMLPELHTPITDVMRCKPECPQSFDTFLENKVTGSFLLSFYKMLFKSNHSDCDMANMRTFLEKYYSGNEIFTPVYVNDDVVKKFVENQLKRKLEEVKKNIVDMREQVANYIIRLKCAVIREVTATITLPVIHFDIDKSFSAKAKLHPAVGLKLTQMEENEILKQVPFLHITVSHLEYGESPEMFLSDYERVKEDDDENDEIPEETKPKQVFRNSLNYHELNKYWTTIVEHKDYVKVQILTESSNHRHHEGMLSCLDQIKSQLKSEKYLHKKKKRCIIQSVEVTPTNIDQCKEKEDNVQGNYFNILYEDSDVKVVQVEEVQYFICLICFDFNTTIIKEIADMEKEDCEKEKIIGKIQDNLKKNKGSFSTSKNWKDHIGKYIIKYKCLLCEKMNQFKTFKVKHDLAAHIRSEHQKHEIFCPICSQSFSKPRYLRNHWFNHENCCVKLRVIGKERNIRIDGFHCSICFKLSHKREEWMKHLNESPMCYKKIHNSEIESSEELSDSNPES